MKVLYKLGDGILLKMCACLTTFEWWSCARIPTFMPEELTPSGGNSLLAEELLTQCSVHFHVYFQYLFPEVLFCSKCWGMTASTAGNKTKTNRQSCQQGVDILPYGGSGEELGEHVCMSQSQGGVRTNKAKGEEWSEEVVPATH